MFYNGNDNIRTLLQDLDRQREPSTSNKSESAVPSTSSQAKLGSVEVVGNATSNPLASNKRNQQAPKKDSKYEVLSLNCKSTLCSLKIFDKLLISQSSRRKTREYLSGIRTGSEVQIMTVR